MICWAGDESTNRFDFESGLRIWASGWPGGDFDSVGRDSFREMMCRGLSPWRCQFVRKRCILQTEETTDHSNKHSKRQLCFGNRLFFDCVYKSCYSVWYCCMNITWLHVYDVSVCVCVCVCAFVCDTQTLQSLCVARVIYIYIYIYNFLECRAKPVVLVVVVQECVVAEELRAEAVRLHAETPRAAEHCLNVGARHQKTSIKETIFCQRDRQF